MAKISMTICDLCKEEIKTTQTGIYAIELISIDNSRSKESDSKINGEICRICHDALLGKLKKAAAPWVAPRTPNNSKQSDELLEIKDVAHSPSDTKSFILSASIDDDGFAVKIPSKAHTVPVRIYDTCKHDRKRMDDDGNFMCLDCMEKINV